MVFTDGGPDHNIRFWNVILSWLAYFISSEHDLLVVARTAPTQSWTNPAERVMSVLNLALQNCALARQEMDDSFEAVMSKCNSMSAVRRHAQGLTTSTNTDTASRAVEAPNSTQPDAALQPEEVTPQHEDGRLELDEQREFNLAGVEPSDDEGDIFDPDACAAEAVAALTALRGEEELIDILESRSAPNISEPEEDVMDSVLAAMAASADGRALEEVDGDEAAAEGPDLRGAFKQTYADSVQPVIDKVSLILGCALE